MDDYWKNNISRCYCFCVWITILLFFLSYEIIAQEDPLLKSYSFIFNTTIENAFKEIEKETGYYFSYNADIINTSYPVEINLKDVSLYEVVAQLVPDSTIQCKLIGNQLVLFKTQVVSQQNNSINSLFVKYVKISGEVREGIKKHAIPYASISISGLYRGTVSNTDGAFSLTVKMDELNDTLMVSCLGYKPEYVPLSQFLMSHQTIILKPDYISIPEVVIRRIDPKYLLHDAIQKIPDNYADFPSNFTGFYRESIKKKKDYIAVSEAIVEGYKASYTKPLASDQIRILKGRKRIDNQFNDTLLLKVKAGLQTVLLLDIVKHLPDFADEEYLEGYQYSMSDIVVKGDKDIFVIDFDPKEYAEEVDYKGKLYIEDKSHAIYGCEFYLNKTGLEKAKSYMILKKPFGYKVKPVHAEYIVKYNLINEKLYLGYIKSEVVFNIRKRKQLFNSVYTMTTEMVFNTFDTVQVQKWTARDIARSGDFFMEQIGPYDPEFWEQYDYIVPDQSLLDAIGRFNGE